MTVIRSFFTTPNRALDAVANIFLVAAIFFVPISQAPAYLLMGLTMAAWLAAGGYLQRYQVLKHNYFAWSALALFILLCLGTLYSVGEATDIQRHLSKYAKLIFMVIAITLLQEEKWRKRSINAFALAMIITLAISMLSLVVHFPFMKGASGGWEGSHEVFKDHISHNLMMSFFVLLMLVKSSTTPKKLFRFGYLALAGCATINIVFFVHGRTGYIALAAILLIFIGLYIPPKRRWQSLLALLLASMAALQFSSSFRSRIELAINEVQNHQPEIVTSTGARIEMYKASIQLIAERPLLGWGTGSYRTKFCEQAVTEELCEVGGYHPHNQFLSFGVQLGLVGILAYLIFLAAAVHRASGFSQPEKVLAIGLIGVLVTDSMLHAPLFLVGEAHFFTLMLALLLAPARSRNNGIEYSSVRARTA